MMTAPKTLSQVLLLLLLLLLSRRPRSVGVGRTFASVCLFVLLVYLFVRSITQQEGWLSPTERASVSAHFGLPWVRCWDNRGKCYVDGKRIQCWSYASQYIPIYLQPFTSYSEILVGNCYFFLPPCI